MFVKDIISISSCCPINNIGRVVAQYTNIGRSLVSILQYSGRWKSLQLNGWASDLRDLRYQEVEAVEATNRKHCLMLIIRSSDRLS